MSNLEDWRIVAQWLAKMRVLPASHKAVQSTGTVIDLGASLRDGVCLCRLLTILNPHSLTLGDYNPHPYNSEFMASRNIMKFLSVCKNFYKLADRELFQVDDLLNLRNFGKVLITLSVLSCSPNVLTGPTSVLSLNKQDNDYYQFNQNEAAPNLDSEEAVYDFQNETGEDIYDSVVHRVEPGRKRIQPPNATSALESVLAEPKTKREHCLREIIEKESNYVQALAMLQKNFIVPLRDKLRADVRDVIFKHIEDLYQIHDGLLSKLNEAVLNARSSLVPDIFIQNKMCFVLYGSYCTNLPDAQAKIEEVCRDPAIADEIYKCEQRDTGKFKLGELLTVPMQRMLKYPLLLNELMKQSAKEPSVTPEERERIKQAIEEMQDVAAYINECKRDKENERTVDDIQKGISDLEMPDGTTLHNYGRMCKDGELRVYKHGAPKANSPRYVFLFEKVLLICKRTGSERFFGGQNYVFKDAIALENYEMEHPSPGRTKSNDRWSAPFYVKPKVSDSREFGAYTLSAKSDVERQLWIKKISEAMEKISPPGANEHGRAFAYTTFTEPTVCHKCLKLLRGAFYQGYHCERTGVDAHKECVAELAKQKFYDLPRPVLPAPGIGIGWVVGVVQPAAPSAEGEGTGAGAGAGAASHAHNANNGANGVPRQNRTGSISTNTSTNNQILKTRDGTIRPTIATSVSYGNLEQRSQTSSVERSSTMASSSEQLSVYRGHNDQSTFRIAPNHQLASFTWFVGSMDRKQAAELLHPRVAGTFLVRESIGTPNEFAISVQYNNTVKHMRIFHSDFQGGSVKWYLCDGRMFDTVPELIAYYETNTLNTAFNDVDCTLAYPFRENIECFVVAMYDYNPTDGKLCFAENDRIAVISKAADDRGWWKGRLNGKAGYFPKSYVREDD